MGYNKGDVIRYDFVVEDVILSGGMGEVYIVTNRKTSIVQAVKTFKKEYFSSQEAIERFIREAKTWVGLGACPNIIRAYNVFHIEGRPCVVIEYAPYGSLAETIRYRDLTVEQVLEVAMQVCSGMLYVHEAAGIVHCDLKPQNIMIGDNRLIKVTDFGISSAVSDREKGKADKAGGPGTWQYMAPEQFIPLGPVWFSTDIYAFGVVLFQLLTGMLPFAGGCREDYRFQHSQARPPDIRTLNDEVPANLSSIVLRCLEKEALNRYQNFREVRSDLESVYRSLTRRPFSMIDYLEREQDTIVIEKGRILVADKRLQDCVNAYNRGVSACELGEYESSLSSFDEALEIKPDFPDAWNGKGNACHALGRFQESEDCYRKAIAIDPVIQEAWMNLGRLCMEAGHPEESLKYFDEALKIDPDIAQFWAEHARAMILLKRLEDAENSINRSLTLNPRFTGALHLKARMLMEKGYLAEALQYLSRILDVNPRHEESLRDTASILFSKKRFSEAGAYYEILCDLHPGNTALLESRGNVLVQISEFDKAYACFKRLTELTPDDADAWYNAGLCLQCLGNEEGAVEYYERALSRQQEHFKACNNLGVCCLKRGDHETALEWFEKAEHIDPANENIRTRIAYVKGLLNRGEPYKDAGERELIEQVGEDQLRRGNYREACHSFLKLLDKGYEETEYLYNIAFCLWQLGDHANSILFCDKVLKKDARYAHAHNIRGNALDDLGNHRAAVESYAKAIEIDAAYYEAHNGMGVACKSLGDLGRALACYEKALGVKPDFYRGWYNKANVLDEMGKTDEAITAWQKTLGLMETDDAWNNLGHCFRKKGLFQEAIKAFEQAIRINPNMVLAWMNKGVILLSLNRYHEALACFREVLRIDPESLQARRLVEMLLYPLMQDDEVEIPQEGLLPSDVGLAFQKAIRLVDNGRFDEAEASLFEAEILASLRKPVLGSRNILMLLAASATAYKKMRKWDMAIPRFERVCLMAERNDPGSIYTSGDFLDLGRCYREKGRVVDALAAFTKALAIARKIDPQSRSVKEIEDEMRLITDII